METLIALFGPVTLAWAVLTFIALLLSSRNGKRRSRLSRIADHSLQWLFLALWILITGSLVVGAIIIQH